VPGLAQWRRGQPERASAFAGAFASALAVAALGWGTPLGLAMLALAFAAHVLSAADAVRQDAFPGFARGVPTLSAALALALAGYAPALWLASALAWPAPRGDGSGERYLVDRWAFLPEAPRVGDRVYFRAPGSERGQVGGVVAGPGQEVEWREGRLWVDGRVQPWSRPLAARAPREMVLTVPGDALLLAVPPEASAPSCGLLLVPREQVVGRAWARFYPVWSRRLI
jgi:hypothetical protein